MQFQAVVRYALTHRGRAVFVLAGCAVLMLIALSAILKLTSGSGNQSALNSAAIQEATAKLNASGCNASVRAESRSLFPFANLAPAPIQRLLVQTEFKHVVELGETQLTDDNIELMNRYPQVDVFVLGPAVTDAALLKLSKLTHVGRVRIESAAASQTGISALKSAQPDMSIDVQCAPAQTAGRPQPPPVH